MDAAVTTTCRSLSDHLLMIASKPARNEHHDAQTTIACNQNESDVDSPHGAVGQNVVV